MPKILDIGCGAGYESKRLRTLGATVYGIDISESSLSIARAKNPEIEFYKHSLLDDYSFIGTLDAIVCIAVFIHIEEDQLDTAFQNMSNALTGNGCVLINKKDGTERKPFTEHNKKQYARKVLQYTKEDLMRYAGRYFTIIKEYPTDEDGWKTYFLTKN